MTTQTSSRSAKRQSTQKGRFGVLDGSRFAAAIAVLLFHFTARGNDAWGGPVSSVFPEFGRFSAWGAYGVDLFFIISGFVILMTAWRKDIAHFIASRFSRLFPAYWFCVLATGALLLWIRDKPTSLSYADVGVNLTMLQSAFGVQHVDGVYWTLWTELRFYVLIGLFVLIGMTHQRVVFFAAAWAPIASLAARNDSDLIGTLLIHNYAPLFAGGMMIFLLSKNPRSLIVWMILLENILIASVISVDHTGETITSHTLVDSVGIWSAVATIVCFAVVMVAVLTPVRSVSWRWLTQLGLLTYPLYLIHEHWGWWIISQFPDSTSPLIVLACAVAACIAAAAAIHWLIERPLSGRLRLSVAGSLRDLSWRDAAIEKPSDLKGGLQFEGTSSFSEAGVENVQVGAGKGEGRLVREPHGKEDLAKLD